MSYPFHDGASTRLYMRYHKPLPTAQGMAVYGDEAFILYDTGVCAVYDLITRDPNPKTVFPLKSYNSGKPRREYLNHANQNMFGTIHYKGNPLPLMYVTAGTGIDADEDGYYYRLCVENLVRQEDGFFKAELLQTVTYKPCEGDTATIGWGCPLSARYRTRRDMARPDNAYIVTKFRLPALEEGPMVRLTAADILDQFEVETDTPFTQGGQLRRGILTYTFGCPVGGYENYVMAFDVKEKKYLYQVDNLSDAMNREEIECCDWYQGKLLMNTNDGGIYILSTEEGDVRLG